MSLALYRRYRPETFAEVIGQDHVTGPLQQALRNDRVNHAYLFSGPRGCGKTTSARILARALNCEKGPTPEPCGVCDSCVDLARTGSGSLDVVEIDAASHGGVDDARDLRERAFYSPASSRYKIYIIDEAHMVSPQGFNALLKVVEEPPPHLKFIFATTEPERVLGTIKSRTHHYPFRLVPPRVLQDYLATLCEAEGATVGPGVLPMVVRAGAGSVRDALSVLDQLIAGAGEEGVTHAYAAGLLGYTDAALLDDVVDAFAAADAASVFELVDRVVDSGIDPRRFLADLLERLRDVFVLQAVPDAAAKGMVHAPPDQVDRMLGQAGRFGSADLARIADVVSVGLTEMRGATAPRLHLELVCARALLPGADADAARGLGARLDRLERRYAISVGSDRAVARSAASPSPTGAPADVAPLEPGSPTKESATVGSIVAADPDSDSDPDPASAALSATSPEPADGSLDLHAVRGLWPAVLDQVKQRRRVTWLLLFDKVQVLGLDGSVLTIGFADAGSVKGFTAGGHDEVLRLAIIDVVGADWTIDAVHQPAATPTTRPEQAGADAAGAATPRSAKPAGRATPTPQAEEHPGEGDDLDDELAGADLVVRELGGQVISEHVSGEPGGG